MNNSSRQQITRQIAQQTVAQADQLYAARQDSNNVSRSIELLRNAKSAGYETAWRLARALFFLGQESTDATAARSFHAEGIEAGKRATRACAASHRSDRVEGYFWLGVNLALLARLEPSAKAAAHALQAKRALLKAIKIDASYHAAGPLRVLARLQHQLPRLLGGGILRARENYERAIDIAGANTVTRMYFAQLLLEIGEIDRARSQLETILNQPFDPDWGFEIKRDQRLAKEMLKRSTLTVNREP